MDKCPRCKLPQKGIYKCEYCYYDLTKYNKKRTTIIRKRFGNLIDGLKENQIVSSNKKSKAYSNNNFGKMLKKTNNRITRSKTDRRKLRYTTYIPEKRSGAERRK